MKKPSSIRTQFAFISHCIRTACSKRREKRHRRAEIERIQNRNKTEWIKNWKKTAFAYAGNRCKFVVYARHVDRTRMHSLRIQCIQCAPHITIDLFKRVRSMQMYIQFELIRGLLDYCRERASTRVRFCPSRHSTGQTQCCRLSSSHRVFLN